MMKCTFGMALIVIGGLSVAFAQEGATQAPARGGRGAGPEEQFVLAPKVSKLNEWVAPHKPHTKLSEVLAKHKGQTDWVEPIVDDDLLHADYISMGPGKKTPRRMNADTREWWVIQDGQIRFMIDGQQPFVASKGYLVQVPYRNMYTMETVGDRPSLRFEVNIAKARKMYPMDVKPVPVAGFDFVPVRVPGKGTYAEGNKPFVDFNAVAAGTDKTRRFVHDDRAVANIILGRGIPPPPLTNKGHFHPESAEFWFILLGKIRYNIEGLKVFEADQGDIVYVPKQRFHLASFAGDADSCRLAMNGYTDLSHSYEAENAR
jgi:mannose-6-phosphate isomerase-like protein (cupin superfamily)